MPAKGLFAGRIGHRKSRSIGAGGSGEMARFLIRGRQVRVSRGARPIRAGTAGSPPDLIPGPALTYPHQHPALHCNDPAPFRGLAACLTSPS